MLNPYLVRDLKAQGLWSLTLAAEIKRFDGDLTQVPTIPEEVAAAARRQKWIDQSQSLNLFLPAPDLKAMSHMYRAAWRAGLKTTYYLRKLGASAIESRTSLPPEACQ